MPLIDLIQHNATKSAEWLAENPDNASSGYECPRINCSAELIEHPGTIIAVGVPEVRMSCPNCTWKGTRVEKEANPCWLDLIRKSVTGDQSGIKTDVDIIMDDPSGNIDYDAVTGVVSLKAGGLYWLFATFGMFSLTNDEIVAIRWVEASNNVALKPGRVTRIREPESLSNGNNSQTIGFIYKATSNINIKLRCVNYTHPTDTITMYWQRSMASICKLN